MDDDEKNEETEPRGKRKMTAAEMVWVAKGGEDNCAAVKKKLFTHIAQREQTTLGEMGEYRQWRELAARFMRNDYGSRVTPEEGNIFNRSNETMGLLRAGLAFVTARACEDIYGSEPWFAAQPEGGADAELARKIQKHLAWKLHLARAADAGKQGVDSAFNFGESIRRTGWRRDVETFSRIGVVWVKGKGSETAALVTAEGDYIYDTDEVVSAWQMPDGSVTPVPEATPGDDGKIIEPEMPQGAKPVSIAAKAPDVVIDKNARLEEWLIEEHETRYDGLLIEEISWMNFRCPPSFADICDSDFRGHIYECRLSELIRKACDYHECDYDDLPGDMLALFEKLRADTTAAKDEARKAQPTAAGAGGDEKNPVIRCMDCEVEWDADGMARTAMYYATVLLDHEAVFFVDFLANVLPQTKTLHRSLYSVIAINQPKGRWHGRGWWEIYEAVQNNTDRLWNQGLVRGDMIANPITGINEDATDEDLSDLQPRPGWRVRLKNNKTIRDFITFAEFPNVENDTWQRLEFMMRLHMLETGVTSAAQGGIGDLPATNTATGIQSVLSSGSTLHKRPVDQLRAGLELALEKDAAMLYTMQDEDETFTYGEGSNTELITLTRADVASLVVNVRLLMTRFKQRELVENARVAVGVHQQYMALPEPEKMAARPLYMQVLKGLDIQNADTIIREAVEQAPQGPPPLHETLRVNFAELPAGAKSQALESMGLSASPEEIRQEEKEKAAKPSDAKEAA